MAYSTEIRAAIEQYLKNETECGNEISTTSRSEAGIQISAGRYS